MHSISNRFNFLAGAYHLAYYFPRNHGNNDVISNYILHFKDNVEPYTAKWIALASREVPRAIKDIDMIVRVLGSSEMEASGRTSLDKLGTTLVKHTNSFYSKSSLRKLKQTRQFKKLSLAERKREVHGLYIFQKPIELLSNSPKILLIDDIITSGTTIKEINRAIKLAIPHSMIYFFSIGKTFDSWRDVNATNTDIELEFHKSVSEILRECIIGRDISHEKSHDPFRDFDNKDGVDTLSDQLLPGVFNDVPPGPNLVMTDDDSWEPAQGYEWVNSDDPNNFSVKKELPAPFKLPGPNLVMTDDDSWEPAQGYEWVNSDDPNNFSVKKELPAPLKFPGPNLVMTGDGFWRPARGYGWVNSDDLNNFSVKKIKSVSSKSQLQLIIEKRFFSS